MKVRTKNIFLYVITSALVGIFALLWFRLNPVDFNESRHLHKKSNGSFVNYGVDSVYNIEIGKAEFNLNVNESISTIDLEIPCDSMWVYNFCIYDWKYNSYRTRQIISRVPLEFYFSNERKR